MNRYKVFRTLRKHVKLAEERSLMYETNKAAKIFVWIVFGATALYIMFFSVIFSLIANSSREFTPCSLLYGFLPFILIVDFLARIIVQRTPAQMIKPYLLLPIGRYACIDAFIVSSIVTPNNLMWLFLTVPYALMSVVFSTGLLPAISFIITFQVIIVCNSLFFMLCRTLFNAKLAWMILPTVTYALILTPWLTNNFDAMLALYASLGTLCSRGNPMLFLLLALFLLILVLINRKVQYHYVCSETKADKDIKLRSISSFSFLNRFDTVGEYLKLEVKMMLRNKNMRFTFICSAVFVVILSLVNSFSDIYDDDFSTKFWAVYPFTLMSINLVRIMCPEGNYIECLLVRKENIRNLLEAKYYFYTIMLIVPLLLMLPTVFSGKYSLLMLLALMLFTAGPMFCVLMHLAIVNRQTVPLNTKLTRKTGLENNYVQVIAELIVFFFPILFMTVCLKLFGDITTYIVMSTVGIIFIALHKSWIWMIYRRMMARKYTNLNGFQTSR